MRTDLQEKLQFHDLAGRRVECDFSGGTLSSDGGLIVLRDMNKHLKLSERLADCFVDLRNQRFVDHKLRELVAQRVLGLCAGYEDLNDHNSLRLDPLVAVAAGKAGPAGTERVGKENKGKALAGASTLNRLESGNQDGNLHYVPGADESVSDRWTCQGIYRLSLPEKNHGFAVNPLAGQFFPEAMRQHPPGIRVYPATPRKKHLSSILRFFLFPS